MIGPLRVEVKKAGGRFGLSEIRRLFRKTSRVFAASENGFVSGEILVPGKASLD